MSDNDLRALGGVYTIYSYDHPDPNLLETFPAPVGGGVLSLHVSTSEFTSLCPKTGQPDWATIDIRYEPGVKCVESKSLKLYLMGFRQHGAFHEACVSQIGNDLQALLDPIWLLVKGLFTERGGIAFHPYIIFGNPPMDVLMASHLREGRML